MFATARRKSSLLASLAKPGALSWVRPDAVASDVTGLCGCVLASAVLNLDMEKLLSRWREELRVVMPEIRVGCGLTDQCSAGLSYAPTRSGWRDLNPRHSVPKEGSAACAPGTHMTLLLPRSRSAIGVGQTTGRSRP